MVEPKIASLSLVRQGFRYTGGGVRGTWWNQVESGWTKLSEVVRNFDTVRRFRNLLRTCLGDPNCFQGILHSVWNNHVSGPTWILFAQQGPCSLVSSFKKSWKPTKIHWLANMCLEVRSAHMLYMIPTHWIVKLPGWCFQFVFMSMFVWGYQWLHMFIDVLRKCINSQPPSFG